MSNWAEGYVEDIDYEYYYFDVLNPLWIRLALTNSGYAFPEVRTACELGYGQGVSVNIHAAASIVEWYGTDFNPAQAAFATDLTSASGAAAKLFDDAFSDFVNRPDLPDFDFIGLHGVWSWISDDNRAVIVELIRKKLKVGGVLYISYNTMPGWAASAPMRQLMVEHAEIMGAKGQGIASRVKDALAFADRLLATDPLFLGINPEVKGRISHLRQKNPSYLAHEFFNSDWHPIYFSSMTNLLKSAKLSFVCSAHYLDHIDGINLTGEQQAFLKDIPDETFRQSIRDFMVNQQFRSDYWIKGARKLSAIEQRESLRRIRVILVPDRSDVALKINSALGEIEMKKDSYSPVIDVLGDHKAKTIDEVEQALKDKHFGLPKIVEIIMALAGKGYLQFVQDEAVTNKARTQTDKLNNALILRARGNHEINHLASPVTGGGIMVPWLEQLFLFALLQGKATPSEWAQTTWDILNVQGEKLVIEGRPLESATESLTQLTNMANEFAARRLPILRTLQIV